MGRGAGWNWGGGLVDGNGENEAGGGTVRVFSERLGAIMNEIILRRDANGRDANLPTTIERGRAGEHHPWQGDASWYAADGAEEVAGLIVPTAKVSIRAATLADLPDVDKLQKANTHQLGFLHRATLEGKIARGEMLVAHEGEVESQESRVESKTENADNSSSRLTADSRRSTTRFAGYVIGSDTYHKREEVGVVYQMAVVKRLRRSTVAATLLRALFASWPMGTKLCCAWCAQDLAANRFWEAMGFVPLAYRAGSEGKERVHLFWQKRITEGDVRTPWWYPSVTGSGAIREDRLVLPIPEGQHWSETRPTILPGADALGTGGDEIEAEAGEAGDDEIVKDKEKPWLPEGVVERDGGFYLGRKRLMTCQMIREMQGISTYQMLIVPLDVKLVKEMPVRPEVKKKTKKKAKPKSKHDPRLATAVRDLRDRWLEHVNTTGLLLPVAAKYAAGRAKGLGNEPAARIDDAPVLPWPAKQKGHAREAA